MSKVLVEESNLTAIASAIRSKLGVQTTYKPGQMAAAIGTIHGEPVLETLTANANGSYSPSTGKDGFSAVTVNVPNTYAAGDEGKVVSSGALVAQTARANEITANGTYDTTENNSVTVNVSGGGGGGTTILHGSAEPTSAQGSNGDIYLITGASGITYDTELNWSCDSDYYVSSTSQLLSTQSKQFYKTVNGGCIAVQYNYNSWWGPILISTVQDYVKYTGNEAPSGSVVVNGVTWYYSSTEYWSKQHDNSASIPDYVGTSDLANNIPLILQAASYSNGHISETKIMAAKLKVSGTWQNLFGSDINSVGGITT